MIGEFRHPAFIAGTGKGVGVLLIAHVLKTCGGDVDFSGFREDFLGTSGLQTYSPAEISAEDDLGSQIGSEIIDPDVAFL